MINAKRRLDKIESSLTPKQAVLLWMEEAHQHHSIYEYAMSLKGEPESAFPLYLLPDQVEKAVVTRMKGRAKDEVIREVREAVRDTVFLYHLHHQVNAHFMSEYKSYVHRYNWLVAEWNSLIRERAASINMMNALEEMSMALPYPLDTETAAAVESAKEAPRYHLGVAERVWGHRRLGTGGICCRGQDQASLWRLLAQE